MMQSTQAHSISTDHVGKESLLAFFALVITFYCIPSVSLGTLMPGLPLKLACIASLILFTAMSYSRRIVFNSMDLCMMVMLLIVYTWNNWDFIIYRSLGSAFLQTLLFFFFVFASKTGTWVKPVFKSIIYIGMFYAFWTIICWLSPQIYYGIVYPIMQPQSVYNLSIQYRQGYMAGFTSHYSANSFYLGCGVIFTLGWYFFNSGSNVNKNAGWFCLLFQTVALLLTGKRGPVVYIILGFLFTYCLYYRVSTVRYIKLIFLCGLVVALFFIAGNLVPSLLNFLVRFKNESSTGDVSTGRFELWAFAMYGFFRSWMFGNGWFWYKHHNLMGSVNIHTHNCYLQWLCELGVVGSIPFFTFAFVTFYRSVVLLKRAREHKFLIDDKDKLMIAIPVLYQLLFLLSCFTSTAYYESYSLCPYIFTCAYTQYLWRKYIVLNQSGKHK